MDKQAKIYVAGHTGLVGSALTRCLEKNGYRNLLLRHEKELDLRDQAAVAQLFREEQPEYVLLAAAKVGGIVANDKYPADFIYTNLMIQSNVIHQAWLTGVKRLLFLGSSCIYPKLAPQPLKEEYLLTGPLEPTNDAYAVAKIAGVKMCQSYNRQHGTRFIAAMPTNLYGINDNFNLETSHVLPALLPPFAIFVLVIGSIYAGFATPTESAALGVTAALILAAINRRLSVRMLLEAIDGTMRTTGMIMLVVAGAWFLNFVLSAIGLVGALNDFIVGLGLSPWGMLIAVILFFFVLGCFMEPLAMMIVTVPVVTPIVVAAGYDPVWFGILVVLLCETAMITPPVGVNLFVVQGVRQRGSIDDVIMGVLPFMVSLLLMIGLIILAPGLVLWLPRLLGGG